MDEQQSSACARRAAYEEEVQDHPHACLDGYVYLGYTAIDEESGEEVELIERLPCRRCIDDAS